MRDFSLYLHIPFCYHKCPYCDFNTYAVTTVPEREYVSALLSELDFRAVQKEWRGRTVATIFFGGGTPSLLSAFGIRRILEGIVRLFPVSEKAEISLEANPGTVTLDTLIGYRESGINRLSFGAQSFSTERLKTLGRIHTPEQTEEAVLSARTAGFQNLSIDLMYGIPGQTVQDVGADLGAALKLCPNHLSAYGLTIEKGTPFYAQHKKRKLPLPPEDELIAMMGVVNRALEGAGLRRYEISNFAQPGKEARHNLAYWNAADYLGIGAGAHSCVHEREPEGLLRPIRWSNYALPKKYVSECTTHGHADSWRDMVSSEGAVFEFLFLGLRKCAGVNRKEFCERFGFDLTIPYQRELEVLCEAGLVTLSELSLALTEKGLLIADSILEEFSSPKLPPATQRAAVNGTPSPEVLVAQPEVSYFPAQGR